ncbi:protein kinase domain-containing protein [Gimesia sp.]|uniref:protein kinase domain-containing protein n=1 Tax=Gimesia sp. TaxID=2024833 RepID=UPI003A94159E
MAMTLEHFVAQLEDSGVISAADIAAFQNSLSPPAESAEDLGKLLVKHKKVTKLQAQLVYQGKGDRLLLGNYLILDKIGAGGMGDVYLAEHRRMERRVALKTLPAAMTRDTQSILRFQREVKAAAKLTHPNIVTAYDADEANGVHYFVMEYVEGIDLSAVVKKRGLLNVDVAVDYILQAAKGLEFAHNKGVIHRDIKPANLLLDNAGTIKILDMGLARIEEEAHEIPATQLTQDGSVMGTVDYMAPEQAKDTHTADARSDIYSLGCSLYYLLTGESVYRGSTMVNRIMAHQNDPIPSLTGKHILISQDVDAVFQKMVAKKPEDRFQSMSEVIVAIENCIQMKTSSTVTSVSSDPELQKFLQSQKIASSPTVVMSADAMTAEKPLTDTQNESLTSGFLNHTLGGTSFQPLPKRKKSIGKRGWVLMGAVLAPLIFMAGIVFKIDTPAGTIILEVDQPELAGAVVSVDEQKKITIKTGEGQEPIEVVADEKTHTLQVTKGGFETFTKQFTVKAGEKETIKVRLEPLEVAEKKVPSAGTPAQDNHALLFDGESSFVEIKTLTGETYLKQKTDQFTIECWITPDLPDSSNPIGYCIASFPFSVSLNGDNVNTAIHGGDVKSVIAYGSGSHTPLTEGRRYHIALLFSDGVQEIYINGKKQKTLLYKTQNGSTSKTNEKISLSTDANRLKQPTGIGAGNDLSAKLNYKRFFKGIIDEVRISNIARYSKDFTPANRFESDEHTMALYHFDEGSGDVLKDSSGNGHDGKIVGARWVKVDDKLQVVEEQVHGNHALEFDGKTSYVDLPVSYGGKLPITYELYIRPYSFPTSESRPLGTLYYGLQFQNRNKIQYWQLHATTSQIGDKIAKGYLSYCDKKITLLQRVHIAGVRNSDKLRLYVDGKACSTPLTFGDPSVSLAESDVLTAPFSIGASASKYYVKEKLIEEKINGFFHGIIDEVRISNTARYSKDFTPASRFESDEHTMALYHFDEGSGDLLKDSSGNGHDGKIVGARWVKVDDDLQVIDPDIPNFLKVVWKLGGEILVWDGDKRQHDHLTPQSDIPSVLVHGPSILFKDLMQFGDEQLIQFASAWKLLNTDKTLSLDLSGTSVSAEGIKHLVGIPLHTLALNRNPNIDDQIAEYLVQLENLDTLSIQETRISDGTINSITNLQSLRNLNVKKTAITLNSVPDLAKLNLHYLNVKNTVFDKTAVMKLHNSLPNCEITWDDGILPAK